MKFGGVGKLRIRIENSYDLAIYYLDTLNQPKALNNIIYYIKQIERRISNGQLLSNLLNNINDYKNLDGPINKIELKKTNGDNLITDNTFYYHPFLRLPVPAPIATQDDVTGEITTVYQNNEDMKSSITLNDILDYTYESFGLTDSTCNVKRDLGALRHMLNSNIAEEVRIAKDKRVSGLDLLLFTIDTARWNIYDNDLKVNNILQLIDYIGEAMNIYKDKITQYSYLNG